jgi:hypothetical protein
MGVTSEFFDVLGGRPARGRTFSEEEAQRGGACLALLNHHYPKGHFAVMRQLHEYLVGDQRDALVLLAGAVLFVLLIVCVNLAALLVTNGEARRREFAFL